MFDSRWYQEACIEAFFNYLETSTGNGVMALPTGTGKAYINAEINRRLLTTYPNLRILNLTHVKELIENNAETLGKIWPLAPMGIYSAGLGERTTSMPIIFGGVASVKGNIDAFGFRHLVLIDECHLLSPKEGTMYQLIIDELRKKNPYLRVGGLSATPYRLGQGMITDGGLFTDICYDVTGYEAFNRLIAEGYLVPPVPKPTNAKIDTANIGMSNGDFANGQSEKATEKVLYEALSEAVYYGADRHCWLAFAPGIKSAEHAAEILNSMGIPTAAVHGGNKEFPMTDEERDARIAAFKRGELRCLVNNNILTTGFDFPPIDLIIMLRATMSPGLWVQMLGRGTRPYDFTNPKQYRPGFDYVKKNCLVLDFAGNTKRLGPINDPVKPRKKGDKVGDAPVRICPQCGCYNHASARTCAMCGHEFTFETKYKAHAATDELLRSDAPVVDYFDVSHVFYARHEAKRTGANMIKVSYISGFSMFHEFLSPESKTPYVKHKFHQWWRQRHHTEPPNSTDEALQFISQLRPPKRIRVWINKQYPEVLSYEY